MVSFWEEELVSASSEEEFVVVVVVGGVVVGGALILLMFVASGTPMPLILTDPAEDFWGRSGLIRVLVVGCGAEVVVVVVVVVGGGTVVVGTIVVVVAASFCGAPKMVRELDESVVEEETVIGNNLICDVAFFGVVVRGVKLENFVVPFEGTEPDAVCDDVSVVSAMGLIVEVGVGWVLEATAA